MAKILSFDREHPEFTPGEYWVPAEVEDESFSREVEYNLPTTVVALASDSGDVVHFASIGTHPSIGRCEHAANWCWCSDHGMEVDHTLAIDA